MIAVDSNVLICAHRKESRLHEPSLGRITELANGEVLWGLPVFCLAEFVRVVTHPRVFSPPSGLSVALEFLKRLLECTTVRLLLPGPAFPQLFADSCIHADASGNLVFDAQIAAVCREHGVTRILTADRDFARFSGMILERPG